MGKLSFAMADTNGQLFEIENEERFRRLKRKKWDYSMLAMGMLGIAAQDIDSSCRSLGLLLEPKKIFPSLPMLLELGLAMELELSQLFLFLKMTRRSEEH